MNFDWGSRGPDAIPPNSATPGQNFSVQWQGYLRLPKGGTSRFVIRHDDGVEVRVGGKSVVEDWKNGNARENCFEASGNEGDLLPLEVLYFHSKGDSTLGIYSEQGDDDSALARDASGADAVIAFMGVDPSVEGENLDKDSILLPGNQEVFLTDLEQKIGKTPLILVLMNGNPLTLGPSLGASRAVLEAWYPGELGGLAIADVLFGRHNPSGRLPVTVYSASHELAPLGDYSLANRTYRYLRDVPQFPFGYGLSYTSFEYSSISAGSPSAASREVSINARVKNAGDRDGAEVVQVYATYAGIKGPPSRGFRLPNAKLVGTKRIDLKAGEEAAVHFDIQPRDLALVDTHGNAVSPVGTIRFWVGGSQSPSKLNPFPGKGGYVTVKRTGSEAELAR